MRNNFLTAVLFLSWSVSNASAATVTIIDNTGGNSTLTPYIGGVGGDVTGGEVVGMKWTQTSAYTNVNIAVSVRSIDPNHQNVTAYLTKKVGAGTTMADVVATATVAVPFSDTPIYPVVTFFTGLNLPAGTYYLVIVGDANATQGTLNVGDGDASPILDAGVTLGLLDNQFAAAGTSGGRFGTVDAFPPASTFFSYGRDEHSGRLVVKITAGAAAPSIQKQFPNPTIPLNAVTSVVFNITNPNSTALTNVAFNDTLPAGLSLVLPIASTLGADCANLSTIGSTATALAITNLQLAAGKTCTASFSVKGTAAGMWNNTTTAISSTEGGIGATSNTASITVIPPPSIGKSFGAASIMVGGTTSLSFNIMNTATNAANLATIAFTDTLPSGFVVASPNGLAGTCGGGSVTANPNSNSVSLSGASLAAGGSCTFSVNVKGTAAGSATNSVTVNSTEGGQGNTATAQIKVVAPPVIGKSFGATSISLGDTTTLTFTITNPVANSGNLTAISFTDALPSGIVVASPNGLTGTCGGGSITAIANSSSVSLSAATLAPGANCTFAVNVKGTGAGTVSNSVTVNSSEGGPGNKSDAQLTVVAPPVIGKSFGAASVAVGGTTPLSFNIKNPAANTINLTGISFTDALPSGIRVATPNGLTGSCGGGAITATAGSTSVSLAAATLAPNGTCTFSVNVAGTVAGQVNNSVTVNSTEGGQGNTATAQLAVAAPPTIGKSFGSASIPLGGTTSLSFSITNPAANTINLTSISFTDALPSGIVVATPNGLTGSCGGGTITATAGSTSVSLAAATLAPNATCTFSINVAGTVAGQVNNSVTVNSTEGGQGNTATAQLAVAAPPTIGKSFGATSIPLGGTTSLSFSITNPAANTINLTSISFTDALPSGIVVATPNGLTGSCGGGAITAVAASSSVSLSGAVLAPATTCTFSLNVLAIIGGQVNNSVSVNSMEGGVGNTATAQTNIEVPPVIRKTFGATAIGLGGTTALSFTITNPAVNVAALNNVSFTDSLPVGLIVATPNGVAGSCGGGVIVALPGSSVVSLTSATLSPLANCTFSVNVTGISEGTKNNSVSATSGNGGTGNTSNASLSVADPPALGKAFGSFLIPAGSSSTLTFTLKNTNSITSLSGISFTDVLPAGLIVAKPPRLVGSCGGGLITADAGSSSISLSGATLGAGASCIFSIDVTGTQVGVQVNTTGNVISNEAPAGAPAVAAISVGDSYLISYAANLDKGDSYVNLSNAGTLHGLDPAGRVCVNVYTFDPAEELISCCACMVTPNGLNSLSARNDLIGNTLTSGVPTSITIKLLATVPNSGGGCDPALSGSPSLVRGVRAWGTTLHLNTSMSGGRYQETEKPFSAAELSATELTKLAHFCGFIQSNGSGFGICKSCRGGSLGAAIQ